jgi:hypothetical protein
MLIFVSNMPYAGAVSDDDARRTVGSDRVPGSLAGDQFLVRVMRTGSVGDERPR